MNVRTRNRLLAGVIVGAVVTILLIGDGDLSPDPIHSTILFIVALLVTYAVFWIVDRYHRI